MTDSFDNKNTRQTVDLPKGLLRKAKERWERDGFRKFSDAVVSLLQRYVGNAIAAEPPLSPNEERLRKILHLVLTKGSEKDVIGIEANLEWVEGKILRESDQTPPVGRQRAVGE